MDSIYFQKEDDLNYNIEYKLKYCDYDNDEEEKGEENNYLFQYDLMEIFKLEDYDEKVIEMIQTRVFNDLVKNNKFECLVIFLANQYMSEDLLLGFAVMFSYDYLYILHKIIVSYYQDGKIKEEYLLKMETKIMSNNK